MDSTLVWRDTAWVQAGDSTRIRLTQGVGKYDVVGVETLSHDKWSIGDSAIATIHKTPPRPEPPRGARHVIVVPEPSEYWLVARTPGRTALRVYDIPPYTGPAPQKMPPSTLAKDIRVIPRIASLRLSVVQDTVRDASVHVRIHVRDQSGERIPGVLVLVRSSYSMTAIADSGTTLVSGPGRHLLIAEFWKLRDSVWVTQLPPGRKR
jgi:hypothetical protein